MREILFVCTGNLCRSPMAEGYFKFLLAKHGHAGIRVRSAGTHVSAGMTCPTEACGVCAAAGFDISLHRPTGITRELIESADLICVMEQFHKNALLVLSPQSRKKIFLLSHWAPSPLKNKEIADPYMKPREDYEKCLQHISESARGLLESFFPQNKPKA